MTKLKPCPFCGGEAEIIAIDYDDDELWYRPECSKCNCGWLENFETPREAITAWNRRVGDEE